MAKRIGANLDALRNKRREEEEEEQRKAANVGASLDALRNKRQTEDIPSFKEALYNEKGFLQNQAARSASAEIPDITTPEGKQAVDSMLATPLFRPGQKVSAVDAPLVSPPKTEKNLGTYSLQNFGAGFISGATSGINAAENVLTDLVTGGERSREMKKLDDYLKTDRGAYDALMRGDPLTEAPTRTNVAKKAGVSELTVKSYKTQGTSEYWKTEADEWAEENDLNAVTKFFLGDAAYQIGMQAPGMMLGAATPFGQSSSSLVETVVDSVKGKSGKDLLKAVGKGTVSGLKNAAKGNTTTWIMAANSAGSKFFENQRLYGDEVSVTANILDSAANGFLESFTEGLGGFSDLPSVGRVLESTVGSKSGTIMRTGLKALLGMVEEGAEEIINVPLGGLADKMTVDPEKKWFGDGGIFDGKEMLVSGMQGALIGGLMGGAGVVAAVNSALAKPDTTKTENAWTANRLADTMNPSEIQLATEMLNREAERFGVEKLDAKKATREDIENTSAQILDKIIEVKDADILSRRDQLIDYALAAPTDSETYRVGQVLAANPEAVTARDLGYLVHAEAERIKQAEASVPAEAVAEAESLVPPDATQTEAQVITTDVQNKVRREAVQRENVSAENGGATVVSELTQKIKNVAPKANIQTVQKLVDAVHMVQTGTMPDKTYNEALNLLRDERVLRTVAAEVGGDFSVDTKNKTTIRASLEAVAKRYAETAEQADMDSLSEEISHAVATLPNYQSPARSASDAITVEGGQITRAEFVRNYGAALAQQGRAADDVFDNLLAAEQTPNAEVNAPIQAAEMPAMMSAAPNADVNAINRDANTFEQEANAPIQAAENVVSRETISPNTTERGVHRLFSEKTPLTEIQRESIQALEMLSRAVNVDIYLYDSAVDTEYGYSSGRYDTSTDRVYVDINAGSHFEGTILRTAGHELTHYLKRWSPEGFEDLSAFVEMTLTESGADIAALMEGKKANALKHGNELSDDIAYEEVIADACQMLLTDSDALYRLSEQNKTLFERVMDFFKEFLDNLRSVYAGYKPTTEAGRIMAAQTQDVMDMLSEVYSDALIRAGKARTEAQKMISGEQSIFADAKTEQGSDLFDYRAMQADMGRYEQMLTEWGGMSEQDVSRLMAMVGHTVDVVRENAQKLDYGYDTDPKAERPFNPVKQNSDKLYKISLDFSTLCRKRIVQSIVAQNLEAALERPLSKEEAIQIREALIEVQKDAKTVEVACALCYVEAARLKTPEQVTKVLQNLPTVLQRHYAAKNGNAKAAVADAEKAAKVALGLPEDKTIKSIKDKDVAPRGLTAKEAKAAIRAAKKAALDNFALTDAQKAEIEYAQTLPVTAFTTAKGLSELAQKHHDLYKAYADAVRSASRSKGLEADVPWRAGDADSISDNLITSMNDGAGTRSHSWSDFQVIHLLDEIAMTIEMATRGAKMHDYTKVPDAVRLRGLTGRMQNMSLIPTRDGNGFDGVEGMPYEIMLLLRDQYPDTAGNICIGVNDEQILRLLDSDEIDYVIPYHHSGNSVATRRALNIPEWTSYQDIQSEKGGGGPAFAEWFDLNRARETAARENASPTDPAAKEKYGVQYGAYKAMQEAADRYLQICAERGLTPKFKGKVEGRNVDFTTHPNYWKLLIDRKMVNQITGEIIEQKPVQPIFDPAVIYGDPADGNVGGILGRALEYYDAHQADTAYAVETVTRAMAENKDTEIGQELSGKQKILNQIIGDSVKAIQDGGVLFEYRETDETYQKAVDAGDTEKEAQIIEATALANGYTEVVFHGTQKFGFTKLDTKFSDDGMSFFATPDAVAAQTYSGTFETREIKDGADEQGRGNYRFFANTEGMLVVDGEGGLWKYLPKSMVSDERIERWYKKDKAKTLKEVDRNRKKLRKRAEELERTYARLDFEVHEALKAVIEDDSEQNNARLDMLKQQRKEAEADLEVLHNLQWKNATEESRVKLGNLKTRDIARFAKKAGYTGVIIRNIFDDGGAGSTRQKTPADIYNFFYPARQLKSADPVTYDDNGNVILPSERFNPKNKDVRFEYRELTPEQEEFFKDSKIRDENGDLKPMYHGTASTFTVFDKSKAGENWYGDSRRGPGFYFANTRGEALKWTEGSKVIEAYLNIKKPLDVDAPPPAEIIEKIDEYIQHEIDTFEPDGWPITKEQYAKNLERTRERYKQDVGAFINEFKYDDNGKMTDGIREFLSQFGYDGIVSKDETVAFYPEQIKLLDNAAPTTNPDIRYDLRINPESAPSTSQRDIASSPEFEAFVKAYDALHGEGAAHTIVRTTEQFDRERARQRKREATAAQMARLPETEAKLRRMAEAAERSRKDESKINAIKNPAVRRAKLSAHLAKQEAEAIRRVAEIDAQMRVADQAYRDNVEMQDRLAEQQARAEERLRGVKADYQERLRGVKADYQERLDRERVRTAQAKFEGKQNASERVQRERYKQWWRNRIHEEDLRQARAEGRENVRQAREEERARAEERLRGVKADYQERLDRERVRTAQAKFEGKQNASERVQRERYKQWWRNRLHEEDLRQARAEGRENVRQAREEEREKAKEHARQVRDYRAFRNRNADLIAEQRVAHNESYPKGNDSIGNMVDRKQMAYNARAAADQTAFERDYQLGQSEAINRTGVAPTSGAPETVVKPYVSPTDTSATPPGNTFKKPKTVQSKIESLKEGAAHTASEAYRLLVNSAQSLDNLAKQQAKAGFKVTASDYVTEARNAPAATAYILGQGLTDREGNVIGKSLSDVVLVHNADSITFSGETIDAQTAFQDYLLHKHNVDRMSFTVRAKAELDALVAEHPWLAELENVAPRDFPRMMFGRSQEDLDIANEWADLNRRYREAKDKPIFGTEDGTYWTAEQSQARVDLYDAEQPWLKTKADELYQWWDAFMREYAVGVSITAEEYEVMRELYPHYVPTYREGKNIGKSATANAGSVSAGTAVKKAKGGTSEVRWIQDTLAEQVAKIVGLQRQNDLLLNLVDSAMLDSDGTLFPGVHVTPELMWYSTLMTAEDLDSADHQSKTLSKNADGTYTVTAWDNGKRVTAYISEDIYNALFSMFGQQGKGYRWLLNAGRTLSNPMKAMITGLNPLYGARNAVRDIQTGLMQAEGGALSGMKGYAKNYKRAISEIRHNSDEWKRFQALGGAGSTHYRAVDGLSAYNEKLVAPTVGKKITAFLGAFNEVTESAARFAAYLQHIENHGDTQESRLGAIRAAAEITTDFSRSGDWGKFINAWIPYTNAATQCVDRALRDLTQGKAINRLTRAAITQAVPTALLAVITHLLDRDDEFDQISDYHKDKYYLIPFHDGKWIRIPREQFYGTILGAGVSRAVEAVLGRDEAGEGYLTTVGEALNLPWAGTESPADAVTSVFRDVALFGSFVDLSMNKDFMGRDIIPSQFKDYSSGEYAPKSEQYTDETSAVAYVLSKLTISALSPIEVDYLLNGYMGDLYHGLASLVNLGLFKAETLDELKSIPDKLESALADVTAKDVAMAPLKLGEKALVWAFGVDPLYSNRYTGEYYDMLDEMSAQITADKNRLPEGEYKNTRTYLTKKAIEDKYGKDISAAYKTARSAVSEAQKRDAREEAVQLSIEALDFYERAMAGKYGSDPSKYVDYEPYGDDVCEALLKLTPYEEEYSFEPNDSYAPSSLTVNKVKYELTDEQRDEYKAMYVDIYAKLARQVISTAEYRTVGDRKKAEMLEAAASDAREETTSRMREILTDK